MAELLASIGTRIRRVWETLLLFDNHIIGTAICIIAIFEWLGVYDSIDSNQPYLSQGIYALPSLSILNTLFSAIYLTGAAIILLSLRQPLSRYHAVWPNLLALLAAFGIYMFVLVPTGDLTQVGSYVGLGLIVCGSVLALTSLVYLRQAFSVTPQARFLVTSGPYSIVRHPMYVGNILSLLGLALLIDSKEAIALFVICAALQVGRALYEERLLRQNSPPTTSTRELSAVSCRGYGAKQCLFPRSVFLSCSCRSLPVQHRWSLTERSPTPSTSRSPLQGASIHANARLGRQKP